MMLDPPPDNPYTSPVTTEILTAAPANPITILVLSVVFAILRAIATYFATMVFMVYLAWGIGNWGILFPLLCLCAVVCLVLHWVEWKSRNQNTVTTIIGLAGYMLGIVLSTMAAFFEVYRGPF